MRKTDESYSDKNASSDIKEIIGQGEYTLAGYAYTPIGIIKVDMSKFFNQDKYYLNLQYHWRGRSYYRRIERKKIFSKLSMTHQSKIWAKELVWSTHVGQVKEFYPDFEKKDCVFKESCICESSPCCRLRRQY